MKTIVAIKENHKCACIAAEYASNKACHRRRNDLPLAPWNSEDVKHPFEHVRTMPNLEDQATEIATQPDRSNGVAGSTCTETTGKPHLNAPVVRLHPWKLAKQRKTDDYQFSHLEPCEYMKEYRKACTSAFVGSSLALAAACKNSPSQWCTQLSAEAGSCCRCAAKVTWHCNE